MTQEEIYNIPIADPETNEMIPLKLYFHNLLLRLWQKGGEFNAKRPWGSSGWCFDVFKALIEGGAIPGDIDEYGFVGNINTKMASDFIVKNIISKIFNVEHP